MYMKFSGKYILLAGASIVRLAEKFTVL